MTGCRFKGWSVSHAEQTVKLMLGLEQAIKDYLPSIVVSEGDTMLFWLALL